MTRLTFQGTPLQFAALAASSADPRTESMTESSKSLLAPLLTPAELARRCQGGCQDSFAELVRLYQDRIFGYLWRLTGNAHDAEDIAQDTFLKAYQAVDRFDGSGSFTSWLFVIAKRTALNHLRGVRREFVCETTDEVEEASPAILLEQTDEQRFLWSLARRLKPNQYEVLWLR